MNRAFSAADGFWGEPRALPLGWYERRLWRRTSNFEHPTSNIERYGGLGFWVLLGVDFGRGVDFNGIPL